MPTHNILYTADLHGNESQYKALVKFALEISPDSIIIGGDIAPKHFRFHIIEKQRRFFDKNFPQLLTPLKQKLPKTKIYLMMGNDDCAANMDVLKNYAPGLYHVIHGKRLNLRECFDIVGYSYVPITPFGIKDWEKYDLSNVPSEIKAEYEHRKRTNYILKGVKSATSGLRKFIFQDEMEKEDSIQKDLDTDLFTKNASKTVYAIHTPPNNTNLDRLYSGQNVGSFAVRLFIQKVQPYITLHGHIHETIEVTGSFKHEEGKTLSMSSGNHPEGKELAVLIFDLYKPSYVERIIIKT